ncbi:MAG: hypothetical protein QM760_14005 [Nibricoccus sp.]
MKGGGEPKAFQQGRVKLVRGHADGLAQFDGVGLKREEAFFQ